MCPWHEDVAADATLECKLHFPSWPKPTPLDCDGERGQGHIHKSLIWVWVQSWWRCVKVWSFLTKAHDGGVAASNTLDTSLFTCKVHGGLRIWIRVCAMRCCCVWWWALLTAVIRLTHGLLGTKKMSDKPAIFRRLISVGANTLKRKKTLKSHCATINTPHPP